VSVAVIKSYEGNSDLPAAEISTPRRKVYFTIVVKLRGLTDILSGRADPADNDKRTTRAITALKDYQKSMCLFLRRINIRRLWRFREKKEKDTLRSKNTSI
jgi:hypothetical protein